MPAAPSRLMASRAWTQAALVLGLAAILCAGCAAHRKGEGPEEVYRAEIRPLNTDITGRNPQGTALFEVYKEEITVTVSLRDMPPGIPHMQHLHGFVDGREAQCPASDADVNNDGAIDLLETEAVMGLTLIPLHDEPAHLAIQGTYPRAGQDGVLSYTQRIPREHLASALKTKHGLEELDLDDMVIVIHGVEPATLLPPSVKTLPGAPAQATLPIACGSLEEVED